LAAIVVVVAVTIGCGSSDEPDPAPSPTAASASDTPVGVPTANVTRVDEGIRTVYEGFLAALNEKRFEEARDMYSACLREKIAVTDLAFGREATGLLTLLSIEPVSNDGSRAEITTETMSEHFIGSQNKFTARVTLILEDDVWRIDGPPVCTV
jgi:hypothetical protein